MQSAPLKSDSVITREEHRKYQFMEVNLQRRMTGLNDKIPDIKKTLETVQFLKSQRVGWRLHHPRAGF